MPFSKTTLVRLAQLANASENPLLPTPNNITIKIIIVKVIIYGPFCFSENKIKYYNYYKNKEIILFFKFHK